VVSPTDRTELLTVIERIVQINALRFVTKEVVEVAREQPVIGLT